MRRFTGVELSAVLIGTNGAWGYFRGRLWGSPHTRAEQVRLVQLQSCPVITSKPEKEISKMAYIIQISYKKKPEVFYNTGKGTISSKKKALAQAKSWTAYKAKSVAKYRVLSVGEPTVVS